MEQNKNQTGSMIAIIGMVVIVVVALITYQSVNKTNSSNATTATQAAQPTTTDQTTPNTNATYKNGAFSAVGVYSSPGGQEELGVTLTITNGIVTDSIVATKATRSESLERQEDFANNYKSMVVGKNIDDLQLGRVSGSSLTPRGFNDAVSKIKSEAKS